MTEKDKAHRKVNYDGYIIFLKSHTLSFFDLE